MKNYIKISGNDWWDKPVDMCQKDYCILQEEDDKVIGVCCRKEIFIKNFGIFLNHRFFSLTVVG